MKVLLASEPKIWGIFLCIECSSILEVDVRDKFQKRDGNDRLYEGFECPICKKYNSTSKVINVNFLLQMRAIKDEISSEQIIIYPVLPSRTGYFEYNNVYYKDIYIGEILYCRSGSRGKPPTEEIQIYYNDHTIFSKDDISESSDRYVEKVKEIFITKIRETNPYIEKYVSQLSVQSS